MKIDEFENYAREGLGRAILLLRKEPDKTPFREAVWNHAIHDPRYDTQCNSVRGLYIQELFDCFDDGDDLLSELLRFYSEGNVDPEDRCYHIGNLMEMKRQTEGAEAALYAIYKKLMGDLLSSKNPLTDGRGDRERDDYFYAASTLYHWNNGVLCDLVRDGVTLIMKSERYCVRDFIDFFDQEIVVAKTEEFTNILEALKKDDPAFKEIFDSYLEESKNIQKRCASDDNTIPSPTNWREAIDFAVQARKPRIPVKESLWRNLSNEDISEIARLAEEESDPIRRAVLISQLRRYGKEIIENYPRDPSPLIAELENNACASFPFSNENLLIFELSRMVAKIRHPAVRDYALRSLPRCLENTDSIPYSSAVEAWLTNYEPKDEKSLEDFVKSVNDVDVLHGIGMDLLNEEQVVSESILLYLYENTPCSTCRHRILSTLLIRYQSAEYLPEHISAICQEALHDCSYGTRMIARSEAIKRKMTF